MSVKSTQSPKRGKAASGKPYAEFPLFPHATGRWAKKIRGRLHYFGKWRDEPEHSWHAALDLYLEQKDDLHAGRAPRTKGDGLTIRDLCNRFLTRKEHQLDTGEIVWHTFLDYKKTTDRLIRVLGRSRPVDDLAADDFELLRKVRAKNGKRMFEAHEIRVMLDAAGLVFITSHGQSWTKQTSNNPITKETNKLLKAIDESCPAADGLAGS